MHVQVQMWIVLTYVPRAMYFSQSVLPNYIKSKYRKVIPVSTSNRWIQMIGLTGQLTFLNQWTVCCMCMVPQEELGGSERIVDWIEGGMFIRKIRMVFVLRSVVVWNYGYGWGWNKDSKGMFVFHKLLFIPFLTLCSWPCSSFLFLKTFCLPDKSALSP